jgi:hypothetical protein
MAISMESSKSLPRRRKRSWNPSTDSCISVLFIKCCGCVAILFTGVYLIGLARLDTSAHLRYNEQLVFAAPELTKTNAVAFPFRRMTQICPSTIDLFPGVEGISKAVRDAEDFHMQGGNIKTIQEYLDQQIDRTYQRLGVRFQTTSGETFSKGIPQVIYQELVKGDTERTGVWPTDITRAISTSYASLSYFQNDRCHGRYEP